MTRMALPELRKAGYDDGLATGCIAAGGSTDILIPPSIILVIYAAVAELSVAKLLAAGLIPGLAAYRHCTCWSQWQSPISGRITHPIESTTPGANVSPPCANRGSSSHFSS